MLFNRLRSSAHIAGAVAGICALVVVASAAYDLFQSGPSKLTAQRLTIVQVSVAGLGAATAIASLVLAASQARRSRSNLAALQVPKLLREDRLVNRDAEVKELVRLMDSERVVSCHGPRGAGKSFLLEHLTDVVNRHRRPVRGQPRPPGMSVSLYFDLADAAGFADIEAQICRAALGDANASWSHFISSVNDQFGRRPVMLVLDNVNSPALWRQLGVAAYDYCARRRHDRVILGSIDPVTLGNLEVAPLRVPGLDLVAAGQLVAQRGVELDARELAALHGDCQGLPLYLRLLATRNEGARLGVGGAAVLDQQLIPELPAATRTLMAYMSLLALVTRRISLSDLRRAPVADLDEQLLVACNRTLITPLTDRDNGGFKVHDVVRDAALRALTPEVAEASLLLFERAHGREQLEHAALYAMFAGPESIGLERFDALLKEVLDRAIKERNYTLLGTLHDLASEQPRILRHLSADPVRADLWCRARATELAGLGRYQDAEEELLSSTITTVRWHPSAVATQQQAELRFQQADVAHLLNRYDEAAELFGELGEWAVAAGRPGLRARCVWGRAHVLRHQGRDLDQALALFSSSAGLADAAGELFAKAYSITGATGIRVVLDALRDDEEAVLARLEEEIAATAAHDGYMLEVWKSQSQVAWLRGRHDDAAQIVEAAIERAQALNDRLLYNLFFERAEFARLSGDQSEAQADYQRVLEFGTGNHDRNLVANAMLGLVLSDVAGGTWAHHESSNAARAAALSARTVASQADIQATAATADRVVALVDGATAERAVRLILM